MGDSGKDFVCKYINIDPADQILDHMKSPLINFRYLVIIFSVLPNGKNGLGSGAVLKINNWN